MSTHTKITITVGTGLRRDKSPVSLSEVRAMRDRAERLFLEQCGAYTVSVAAGGWRDGACQDSRESVLVFTVTVVYNTSLDVQKLAEQIRDIFEQQCVALETQPVNFELV